MQTQAVVFTAEGKVALQDIEMPAPRAGEVQVRTEYSTISVGTEGWMLTDQFYWAPTPYPCVPGYQRSGTILAVGSEVEVWRVGDRVMAAGGDWEGEVKAWQGGHAAIANVPAHEPLLFHIPEGVDSIDASALVVAQVGYNAASRVACEAGDWAVVFGDGIIGQSAAQAARARGMKVVLVGHRPERLKLAAQYSADEVINSHDEKPVDAVRKIVGRDHVCAVLDSIQGENVQQEYMNLLEQGRGQIVYCGFTPKPVWADMGVLQQREFTIHFVSGWSPERMKATLALMAVRRMRIRPLITHLVPPGQAVDMYQMILKKNKPFMGVTLNWSGEEL